MIQFFQVSYMNESREEFGRHRFHELDLAANLKIDRRIEDNLSDSVPKLVDSR